MGMMPGAGTQAGSSGGPASQALLTEMVEMLEGCFPGGALGWAGLGWACCWCCWAGLGLLLVLLGCGQGAGAAGIVPAVPWMYDHVLHELG